MSYVLTPQAEAELSDAALFCRTHFGPVAAENFLSTFEAKVRLIADFPGVGTATSKGRRLYPIGRYPFSILYRVDDGLTDQRHRAPWPQACVLARAAIAGAADRTAAMP